MNRFGASLLDDRKKAVERLPAPTASPRPAGSNQASRAKVDLNRNPMMKAAAGGVAQQVGNAAGVVRGGVHTVEGLVDGAVFLGRLASPVDALFSAPGQSAAEQLGAPLSGAPTMSSGASRTHKWSSAMFGIKRIRRV